MLDFGQRAPFVEWLWTQIGGRHHCLTWGHAIELTAEDRGIPPMDQFFELLDKFRAEAAR